MEFGRRAAKPSYIKYRRAFNFERCAPKLELNYELPNIDCSSSIIRHRPSLIENIEVSCKLVDM